MSSSEVTGSLIVQFIGYTQVSLGLLYLAFVFVSLCSMGFLGLCGQVSQKITKIAKRWNCLAFLPTMAGTDDPHWRHHHPVVAAGDTTNEGIDPPDGAPEGKDQLTVHQRTECGTKKNEPNLDAFNAFNAFRRTNKSHCCLDAFKVLRTVHSFKDRVSTEVSLLAVDAKHGPSTETRRSTIIQLPIKKLCAHLAHQRQYNLNFK